MNKSNTLKNCIYYFKRITKYDCLRIPGVLLNTLINAFDIWFLKVFAIKVIVDALLDSFDFNRILYMLFIAVLYKTAKLIYDSFWAYYTKLSDQKIISGFQHTAFSKAADVDLKCYDDSEFYNNYVYSVQESSSRPLLFITSISQLLQTVFTVSFSGIYVIFNDPYLLIFAIMPILGDSFLRTKMNRARAERTALIIPENRKLDYVKRTSYLRENAVDIRITKIHVVLKNLFQSSIDGIIDIYKKYSNKFIGMYFLSDCLTHISNTLVIVYLIFKIVVLKTLTAGDFIAIKESIDLLSSNLGKIMERLQIFQEHSIYIDRFRLFCEYKNKVVFGDSELPEKHTSTNVLELKDVTFAYNPDVDILKNINISIREGDLIAIVGSNGAGKSSLVKLLLHLYDPTYGSIKFRGKDIRDLSRKDYISKFDVVFQEHNSYAFSLVDNILFKSNISDNELYEIKRVFTLLGFDEFLETIDNNAITLTKEFSKDGLILSGGQNQKVALARALYRDNSILILDEPSSALDAISEHKLMKSMIQVAKGRTVILISHRLSSVRDADCIYFMENGEIIEYGTHDELMAHQGRYCEMFTIQAEAYRN